MSDAIAAGAGLVNDVSALKAPAAIDVVAASNVAVCLMHMQGEPRTMQDNPDYDNVVADIRTFLQEKIEQCIKAGIDQNRIIIDHGFGFGKTLQHNLLLLKNLHEFKKLGVTLLAGLSRKSMIGAILDKPVDDRLVGSTSLAALAAWQGANILRVHDVAATSDALKIIDAVQSV